MSYVHAINSMCFKKSVVLPGGNYNNGSFNNVGSNGNFWSASESGSNAYNKNFDTGASMSSNTNNKTNGYSVRLVKDSEQKHLTSASLVPLLYRSYLEARKNKRNTNSQLVFENNLEHNLLSLAEELENRTYVPQPSICFINEKPVKREVVASNFRDRVVHHLLCSWLFPIFEKQFIYDSYSCRENKGTLFGINRIRKFVKSASDNYTKECWVLKLDIKGFFMSIDKNILYSEIIRGLDKAKWKNIPDVSLCEFIIRTIVFSNPIKNCIFKSPSWMWNDLPKDKSLKYSPDSKGLPIGNLTSQLFANIYLNPLDQFVKRDLKIHYYGRYVDDMVLIHRCENVLLNTINKVRLFLKNTLSLVLHPNKIKLQQYWKGFQFIGAYIVGRVVYPTKRVRNNFTYTLQHNPKNAKNFHSVFKYLNGCF